jgi:hypothetical protein
MQTITGIVMLAATAALFFHYKPRANVSIWLCVLCAAMAVITPLVPMNTWFLQFVAIGTKSVAMMCCYVQLSRECRERRANAARARRAKERKKISALIELEQRFHHAA